MEYFAVVAEHGNVRRASEILDLSPPALSKSLRRLETSVGAKLVKRTSKGVELTPVGAALASQVRRIRLTLDDVRREAADLSEGRAGHLRIGASPVHADELPAACTRLLKEAPTASMAVTVTDNDVMIPALRNGELDLVFNYLAETPYEGCDTQRLYEDDIVVYASASHPLARKRTATMAELTQERWSLSTVNMLPWHWLYRAFQDRGYPPPRVAVESRAVRLRLQTVASSNLLGFLSRRVVRQAASQYRLKEIAVKDVSWRRPSGVIYRQGGYLSPAGRRLINLLKETTKDR